MIEKLPLSLPQADEHPHGIGTECSIPTIDDSEHDDSEHSETAMLREARQRRIEQLEITSDEIAQLKTLRDKLRSEISAFDVIWVMKLTLCQFPNISRGRPSKRRPRPVWAQPRQPQF